MLVLIFFGERTHDLIKTHYGSLDSFLARHEADIFCIQETRVGRASMSSLAECKNLGAITEAYESFWSFNETLTPRGMNGTNGVAVWIKKDLAKGATATQRVLEDVDFGESVLFSHMECHDMPRHAMIFEERDRNCVSQSVSSDKHVFHKNILLFSFDYDMLRIFEDFWVGPFFHNLNKLWTI